MGKSLFDDGAEVPSPFEELEVESNVQDTQETQEALEENKENAQEAEMAQEPEAAIEDAESQFDDGSNEVPIEEKMEDFTQEEITENKITKKEEQANAIFEREYLSAQGNPNPIATDAPFQGYRQKTQLGEVDLENDPRSIALYARGSHNPQSRFANARAYELVWSNLETPIEHEIANLYSQLINQSIDITAPLGDESVITQLLMADFQNWIMTMRAKYGFERISEITNITKNFETKKFSKQHKQDKTGFGLDSFKREKGE